MPSPAPGAGQMLRYKIVGRSDGDFVAGVRARKETPLVQIWGSAQPLPRPV